MKTAYSYETSLPALLENQSGKQIQKNRILQAFRQLGGKATLKQVQKIMDLPQGTISGRFTDLMKDGKIIHEGFIVYEGRKRKLFHLVSPELKQQSLFSI